MSEKFSPKLKTVMAEIKNVLEKHDVGGLVILNDGEGHGEYRMFLEEPSWSNLRFLPPKKNGQEMRIHTKMHMKSKPKETQMTVNMIFNQLDVVGGVFMILDKIKKNYLQHIEIDEERGEFYHGD